MMNQKERLETMEQFFWRLQLHRTLTMREDKVLAMLKMVDSWVEAHSNKNGERSDKEIKQNVAKAYENLKILP